MTEQDDERKYCLEFADFPGSGLPWLTAKAEAIERAIGERLSGVFLWHSVVADPEIHGFRVCFEIDPDGGGISETVPETLVAIIRETAVHDLPDSKTLA